jgi:hypothetical protein
MNSRQTFESSPRSIRLSISACTTTAFLVAPFDQAARVGVDCEGGDQH